MSTKADKFVKTYKQLSQIPAALGGTIRSNGVISSLWSQRDVEKGKTTKFIKNFFTVDLKPVADVNPIDVSTEVLSRFSKSEKYRAVLRDLDSKQYLEIWQGHNTIRTVDLNALDVHGSVYSDGEFSSFEWSPDEKKLLYVAEKKPIKSEPFYKRKSPTANDEGGTGDEEKSKGEEYLFIQDWGEQLVGKKYSILAEYDVESDSVTILKGLPDNICIAQPKYSNDGSYIVGVAYEAEPRKLGLIYCSNRLGTIFRLDFSGNYLDLPLKDVSVKSPIFSCDGKTLLWLQRKAGGPHAACMSLVKTALPLSEKSPVETVVPVVDTEIKINGGKSFYGLYNSTFLKRPWASGNRLIVNTNQKYAVNAYVIDIENGDISELSYHDGSQIVFDVKDDILLATQRTYLKPDKLVLGKLSHSGANIVWTDLTSSQVVEGLENCTYQYLDLIADEGGYNSFNATYVGPKDGKEKSVPLIVWPHGGPHSSFTNNLILQGSMYLKFGFAILFINYRGSTGCGQKCVEFLTGKIGDTDVKDCVQATDTALKNYPWLNPDAMALVGGSHGGFLVAHLSGQYPDRFHAVVARNPVIDVSSMSIISDIPDWCYVEAGKEYTQKGEIDNDILLKMRKVSPIMHAHKVKAPTMLHIGSKDLRVPHHQGTEFHLRLKANGIPTRDWSSLLKGTMAVFWNLSAFMIFFLVITAEHVVDDSCPDRVPHLDSWGSIGKNVDPVEKLENITKRLQALKVERIGVYVYKTYASGETFALENFK